MSHIRISAAARLLPAVLLAAVVVVAGGASLLRTTAGFQPLGFEADVQQGSWLVTGKLWPSMFEVRFVPAGSTAG